VPNGSGARGAAPGLCRGPGIQFDAFAPTLKPQKLKGNRLSV
jgi:hypothetical protein